MASLAAADIGVNNPRALRIANLAIALLLSWALICEILCPQAFAAGIALTAKAAVLMDLDSGKIVWQKNQNLRLPPASTAKILNALIVLERNRLSDVVAIPTIATTVTGATIPLQAGERLSVEALLYGMLLGSGNDAAVALAHQTAGSLGKFVALMNEKARALGAHRSKFLNPTGVPQADQLSSALDLALITKAALAWPEFRQVVGTKSYSWKSSLWDGELKNSNRLLDDYEGAIGVKTGSTNEAGYCLVAAATRGNRSYLAVILKSSDKAVWQDATKLLDHGFAQARSHSTRINPR